MARGAIYPRQLKDGRTVFDVRYRSSNGRQCHKRGFARKREAERYLTDQLALVHRGALIVTDVRFAAYFDAWLAGHRLRLEAGTYRDYEIHGRLRLKPFFGTMKLSAITAAHVREYVAGHAAAGRLSVRSINNSVIVLGVALAHAVDDGLIAANPAVARRGARERIRLPEAHREMDYLRLREIPVYLAGCSRSYRPLAELLIATGMRIGEALGLCWRDVDLDARRIRVLRAAKRGGPGSTKGDRARAVDIGPRLQSVLRDVRDYQALWLDLGPDTLVFARRSGGAPGRSLVSSGMHKRALARAGLRDLRLHDLRHTAAATWLAAGLPLIYVQRQLGHASLSTTESIYAHLEDGLFAGAPAAVEQAIWSAVKPHAA
jgi:integrase